MELPIQENYHPALRHSITIANAYLEPRRFGNIPGIFGTNRSEMSPLIENVNFVYEEVTREIEFAETICNVRQTLQILRDQEIIVFGPLNPLSYFGRTSRCKGK